MAYKKEFKLVNEFIERFNPNDFTTQKNRYGLVKSDHESLIRNAQKLKARIQRKQMLRHKYLSINFREQLNANEVMISQEQIDELLTKK